MAPPASAAPKDAIVLFLDDYDLAQFTAVAAGFGQDSFGFVVTPNVDHLIRYHDDGAFRDSYAAAEYVLLDSRLLARLLRLTKGLALQVCTGSDLTATLFSSVIRPADSIVLIGGTHEQSQRLAKLHGLSNIHHFNPPMGFIKDPAAVRECVEFVEAHSPFRFCFIAVGSPQQESLAVQIKSRARARGLGLCIGASLNFIIGSEKRAPKWVQRLTLEWLYRLLQNPRRLARRYLIRGPRILACLRQDRIVVRNRRETQPGFKARASG
jgi:exopolysaccharide biosynthesis WecB/TagA/CpsF family protein